MPPWWLQLIWSVALDKQGGIVHSFQRFAPPNWARTGSPGGWTRQVQVPRRGTCKGVEPPAGAEEDARMPSGDAGALGQADTNGAMATASARAPWATLRGITPMQTGQCYGLAGFQRGAGGL